MKNEIVEISVGALLPSLTNPRKQFVETELEKLTESVRERGVINPILVRALDPDLYESPSWEIVAGERRWRASVAAGLEKIPCIVRELTEREKIEIQLVENIDRHDLNPMEEADGVASLVGLGVPAAEVAGTLSRGLEWVQDRLNLMDLPSVAQASVRQGALGLGAARALGRLRPENREAAHQQILELGDDVTERQVRDMLANRYLLPKQRRAKWEKRKAAEPMESGVSYLDDCETSLDYIRAWGEPYGKHVHAAKLIGAEAMHQFDESINWGQLAAVHTIDTIAVPVGDVAGGSLVYVVNREKVRHAEAARRESGQECTLGKRVAEEPQGAEATEEKGERKKEKGEAVPPLAERLQEMVDALNEILAAGDEPRWSVSANIEEARDQLRFAIVNLESKGE